MLCTRAGLVDVLGSAAPFLDPNLMHWLWARLRRLRPRKNMSQLIKSASIACEAQGPRLAYVESTL